MLLADYTRHVVMRDAGSRITPRQNPSTAISRNITRNGFTQSRPAKPAGSDFAYSGPLTEAALLGNVAFRAGCR
jgi:hypothetical protein